MTYCPEGGSELSLELSDPAAFEATLIALQCNTSYTISVHASRGDRVGVYETEWSLRDTVRV